MNHILNVLKKMLPFIVMILMIDFLMLPMSYWVVSVVGGRKSYCFKDQDIIVLGDSHTAHAVIPSEKYNLRNFSEAGLYAQGIYYILKDMSRLNIRPKAVVISTALFMFKNSTGPEFFLSLKDKSLQYEFIQEELLSPRRYFDQLMNLQFNATRFNNFILQKVPYLLFHRLLGKSCNWGDEFWLTSMNLEHVSLENKKPEHGQKHDYLQEYSFNNSKNKENVRFFIKLIDFASEFKVPIYFTETPEYEMTIKAIMNKESFYRDIRSAVGDHPYVTFLPNISFRLDTKNTKLFYDGGGANSHLSAEGAKMFTKELLEKIGVVHE